MKQWFVPAAAISLLMGTVLAGGNVALFLDINGAASHLPDAGWSCLTVLGDTLVALVLLLPLARYRPDWAQAAVWAALPATLLTRSLKHWLDLDRPAAALGDSVHVIGPVLHHGSFPSGHTATVFVLAAVVMTGLRFSGPSLLVAALALLVGISRVGVGAHWPVDVAGGMLIGWTSGLIGIRLAQWRYAVRVLPPAAVQAILLGCAVWLLVGYDSRYPLAWVFQKAIALGALAIYLQSVGSGWQRARVAARAAQVR